MQQIDLYHSYCQKINQAVRQVNLEKLCSISDYLWDVLQSKRQVFLCGNGGSAANAMHIANDFIYGIGKRSDEALKVHALSTNQSILTCLANDISYDDIFSYQLEVLGQQDDILIALSGSGNSPNIVKAIKTAKKIGMHTFAILGYDGGRCLAITEESIHIPINDMQIAEDMQLIIGHMLMQWLNIKIVIEKKNIE
ncbi:MAG: SIS domain-containing protein [Negativicutes bacterium]|nr:SIS domain-containing protein [Negativicutes bacterium]